MLKSRIKRLEEKAASRQEDKIIIIQVPEGARSLWSRGNSENEIPVSHLSETLEEFRERVRRLGQKIGIWVGLNSN